VLPEIATVPAGLAPRVPANGEPSDMDTEKVAIVVPADELSSSDVVVVTNVMPVGVGRDGEAMTLMITVAAAKPLVYPDCADSHRVIARCN
jgi:hypothetical protein